MTLRCEALIFSGEKLQTSRYKDKVRFLSYLNRAHKEPSRLQNLTKVILLDERSDTAHKMPAEDMDLLFEDVLSVLRAEVGDLGDTSNPPTPAPTPTSAPPGPAPRPVAPAGQNITIHPQPVQCLAGGQYDGRNPLRAPLLMAAPGLNVVQIAPVQQLQAVMQPAHLHSQGGAHSQGQCTYVPVMRLPEIPAGFTIISAACPPPNTSMSKKRKRDDQQDDRPYIKKPPNAFMLYMKEQRPKFAAEISMSGSAAVNAILGQRWTALSKEEQAKYFVEANKERLLHEQRYPGWPSLDNYGKKRKRDRSKGRRQRVTLVDTSVMQPSSSQSGVIEGHQRQTVLMQHPHAQAPATVHATDNNTPSEACTAMVSPAAPMETQTTESHYLAVPDPDSLWEEVFEPLPLRPQPQPWPLPQQQQQHQPEPEPVPDTEPEPEPPCGGHFILSELERLNSVLEEHLEPPPLRPQPQLPSGTRKAEAKNVVDFNGLDSLLAQLEQTHN